MKGLITKDFCLMIQRKRSFIIILICALMMSFSSDTAFFMGWLIMIGALFALSTIAYDEHENCYPFLMTLPVSRKCYACEKYIFGIICALIFWSCGVLFWAAAAAIRGNSADILRELPDMIIILFMPLVILDVCIPFNLKYGSEKSRVYMLICFGAIFAAGFVIFRLIPGEGGVKLPEIPASAEIIVALLFTAAATAASVAWSVRIMEKKEF